GAPGGGRGVVGGRGGRPAAAPPGVGSGGTPTPFVWRGIRPPPVQAAAAAQLPDDAPVAGVVAGGQARAYLLTAMTGLTAHVVNDLVGGTPVTVTYCDRTDCLCGFTADTPGQPLEVNVGGWAGKLMLKGGDT